MSACTQERSEVALRSYIYGVWYNGITHASGACNPSSILGTPTSFVESEIEDPATASLRSATTKKRVPCFFDLRATDFF